MGLTINAQFGASVAMSSNGSVVAIGAPHGQAGEITGPENCVFSSPPAAAAGAESVIAAAAAAAKPTADVKPTADAKPTATT